MTETTQTPVFRLERVFLKDFSFETPVNINSIPADKVAQAAAKIDRRTEKVGDRLWQVAMTVSIDCTVDGTTIYRADATHTGIFFAENIEQSVLRRTLLVNGCELIFPYIKDTLEMAAAQGGYGALGLAHVDFAAMYKPN